MKYKAIYYILYYNILSFLINSLPKTKIKIIILLGNQIWGYKHHL